MNFNDDQCDKPNVTAAKIDRDLLENSWLRMTVKNLSEAQARVAKLEELIDESAQALAVAGKDIKLIKRLDAVLAGSQQEELAREDDCWFNENHLIDKLRELLNCNKDASLFELVDKVRDIKTESLVVMEILLNTIEHLAHDDRVPNEISQECAAVLLKARHILGTKS